MRKYIVYKITNTITNKSYIGTTSQKISDRWGAHLYMAFRNEDNYKFYNAIRKYGSTCWLLETIFETTEKSQSFEHEIKMIDSYNTIRCGYNTSRGGEGGSHYWDTLTEEEKLIHNEKISISKKGKSTGPHSEKTKIKQSDGNKKWRQEHPGYSAKRKTYLCYDHATTSYYIVDDLKKFCKEFNITYGNMLYNERTRKLPTKQNWSCRSLTDIYNIDSVISQIHDDIKKTKTNINTLLRSVDRTGNKNGNYKDGKRCREQ